MSARPLNELTRDPVDEAQIAHNWRAIRDRRAGDHRAEGRSRGALRYRALAYGSLGVAFAAAAALLLVSLGEGPVGPLTLADGSALTTLSEGTTELADGSRVELSEGGSLEVLESSAQRVALRLAQGRARFSVTPNGPRRWVIEAGARVEVVGTVFTVDRGLRSDRGDPPVEVRVERGVVLVFHEQLADGVRRLTAGQRVRVGAPPSVGAPAPAAEAEPSSPEAQLPEDQLPEDQPPEAQPPEAQPEPIAAASHPRPRPAPAPAAPTAAELMERADIARSHGDDAEAAQWLERALERYPHDSAAAMAAYTLGNLELERLRRPDRAVRAYEQALRAGLPSSSAETVRARQVEAFTRAGRAEEARAAAEEYHRRYPSGRWTQEVDRWTP